MMSNKILITNSNKIDILSKEEIEIEIDRRVSKILDEKELELESKRVAQIGELLSMIAHQWRQPLAAISIATMSGRTKLELDLFDLNKKDEVDDCKAKIIENYHKIDKFVHSLSQTIDNFRDFFKPNQNIKNINIDMTIIKVIEIAEDSLLSDGIKIIKDLKSSKDIEAYDSELMQVFLNILKNSHDCLRDNKGVDDPYIHIESIDRDYGVDIIFTDNGGGIKNDIIEYIFDPYFSTKSENIGTGLGLSMSKTIIEKHHKGTISANNTDDGLSLIISLNDMIP